MLTAKRLREVLEYNPRTGEFTWLVDKRGRFARTGAVAGTTRPDGRRQIQIKRKFYLCNRLAVLWMTGRWPTTDIDHINCQRDDNRWRNLRSATNSQNGANTRGWRKKAQDTPKGVTWDAAKRKYSARIKVNYKTINLGRFATAKQAQAAYAAAAQRYFGEFARAR